MPVPGSRQHSLAGSPCVSPGLLLRLPREVYVGHQVPLGRTLCPKLQNSAVSAAA